MKTLTLAWFVLGLFVSVAHAGGTVSNGPDPATAAAYRESMVAAELARSKQQIEEVQNQIKGLNTHLLGQMTYIQKVATTVNELRTAYQALSEKDKPYDPNTRPPGAPSIPVSCATDECAKCYKDAQESLNKAVYTLEKLRSLYTRTKTFSDKAMAFGDSASGIHAVTGLAWQAEKRKIEQAMKGMNNAFDAKKPELMSKLKASLDQISACEQEHYSNPDWYNRFGFAYHQFMEAKYSR